MSVLVQPAIVLILFLIALSLQTIGAQLRRIATCLEVAEMDKYK